MVWVCPLRLASVWAHCKQLVPAICAKVSWPGLVLMVARGWPVGCWRLVLGLLRVLRELLVVQGPGLRQMLLRPRLLSMLQVWQHPLLIWALLAVQRPQPQHQCFPQPIWQATQRECRPDESP